MAGLRALIDGRAVDPMAKDDVFNHLKNVKDKQGDADIATLKLHQKLAPAKQLIDMVEQEHPLPGADDQQQQYDEQGNPIQNDQAQPGQQTNPMNPQQQNNQALRQRGLAPMNNKPGMPGAKKPAPTAGKSASGKSSGGSKDKSSGGDKKKDKGFEVHIRGGGPGSGRHSTGNMKDRETENYNRSKLNQLKDRMKKNKVVDENDLPPDMRETYRDKLRGSKIDQMNVKKMKSTRQDYHDDGGGGDGAGRGIGLSGGGPGSGRKTLGMDSPAKSRIGRRGHIQQMKQKGYTLIKKGSFPNGTLTHSMKSPSGRTINYQTFDDGRVTTQ